MNPPSRIPPALWQQVSALFDEALDLPDDARAAWLQSLSTAHPEAAPHVLRLLQAHTGGTDLTPPAGDLLVAALGGQVQALAAGTEVGIYRLQSPLGRGGMATVWAADQLQGVRRRVALKLPHAGLEAPAALARRFEQERDLLAALEHPNIARLYDAGIAPGGQPWLAMELIEGRPITVHARELPLRERLRLFMQVLDAVSFAHARLVIHRDIKPGNILVTPQGQAKLLDFGIARLLGDAEPGAAGLPSRAFTPDGASPEQLTGQVLGVASDVYALGVVLYELVCGARAYRLDPAAATPLAEQLAAWPWTPPSARARAEGAPAAQQRALAGDIDAIVHRAMQLDPAQRYPSAEALAADLQRHLDLQPVAARGASRRLATWRLVQRHRVAVGAGVAVVLALGLGLAMALWQAREARLQTARAQAVQRFLVQIFQASHPEQAQGRQVSAQALLDQGAARLDTELRDQPEVRAELHAQIGGIYLAMGDNVQALRQLDRALELFGTLGQLDSDTALEAEFQRLEVHKEAGRDEAARAAAARLQPRALRVHGPGHRWDLPVREQLAWLTLQRGDAAGAQSQLLQALQDPPPGSDPVRLVKMRSVLAEAQSTLGLMAQAQASYAAVVEAGRTLPGYERTDHLVDRYNVTRLRYIQGEHAAAAAELAALLPDMDRHIGPRHDRTIKARALWALSLSQLGRHREAADIQQLNLQHTIARGVDDDGVAGLQRLTLATLLRAAGRYAEGLPLATQGLQALEREQPGPTWLRERARWIRGELLLGLQRTDEALAAFDLAVTNVTALQGYERNAYYPDLLQSRALAWHRRGAAGDDARARAALAEVQAWHERERGAHSPGAQRAALLGLWLAWLQSPRDASVAAVFDTAAQAWAARNALAAAETALLRAEALAAAGRGVQAAAERERGARGWHDELGVDWPGRVTTLH